MDQQDAGTEGFEDLVLGNRIFEHGPPICVLVTAGVNLAIIGRQAANEHRCTCFPSCGSSNYLGISLMPPIEIPIPKNFYAFRRLRDRTTCFVRGSKKEAPGLWGTILSYLFS